MCDPESFMEAERDEQRSAARGEGRFDAHLAAARAELPDRPSRHELRREGRELEEDLRARREARR
jgi:hypothetical protein